jgi:hypothetical protein
MTIKFLKQNLNYFNNPNKVISSYEIDNRFNNIVNYLNDEIIDNLNNLNSNIIVGSTIQSDINTILKSKSDSGYFWKKIDNDDFTYNSIDIKKLNYKNIINSIFRASASGSVEQIKNQNMANNTIVCTANGVMFDRISNDFIDSTTRIVGDKIAFNTIGSYNLSNIKPSLLDNTVISNYIKDKAISTSKIADNSLSLNSFNTNASQLLMNYIWGNIIPKNFINLNNIGNRNNITNRWGRMFLNNYAFNYILPVGQYKKTPYTIPLTKFNNFYVKNIIKYYTTSANITDLSLTDPLGKKVGAEKRYILSPNVFKPNSINANRLVCWFNRINDADKCYNINNILAGNTITIDHLSPAIKAKLDHLSPAIQAKLG